MSTKQRVWTEAERRWQAHLEGDPIYGILPMSELYPTLPDPYAYEEVRERFGGLYGGGGWCKLMMAHQMPEMMRDVVCLIHGTLNCNACIRNFHSHLFHQWGHGFIHTPTTAIDKRQVIFGGEDELYDAIKAVDRDYHPQLIMIFPGCAPGLVQDDIPRILERAQPEVSAKLFYYPTAGYELTNIGLMIEEITQMWVDLMDPPSRVDKEAVNILGSAREVYWPHARGATGDRPHPYPSDVDILGGYIEDLGLKVHRVLQGGGDYHYLRAAPEAGLNVISCGTWGFPLAQRMKERFGTPFLREELPLGVEAASRWIRGLAQLTGREEEAERLIQREYEAIKDIWQRCKEMVAGRTAIIGGLGNRAASYLRFCKELGMEIIYIPGIPEMGMVSELIIKAKRVDWDYFLDYGLDPMVIKVRDDAPWVMKLNYKLFYLPVLAERLGLSEDEVIFMYCDFATAGHVEPSRIAYVNSSTHLGRRAGYPTRAVGFRGTEGMCLDLMDAVKVAKRKESPTLYTRIYDR